MENIYIDPSELITSRREKAERLAFASPLVVIVCAFVDKVVFFSSSPFFLSLFLEVSERNFFLATLCPLVNALCHTVSGLSLHVRVND